MRHARALTRRSCQLALPVFLYMAGSALLIEEARAQDDLERAKELFKDGERFYKKGDFKAAASAFTQAYELSKRDELLYYMGTSWEALGDIVTARRYYQLYLNNVPDAPNAEKILDRVIELQRRINKEMGRVSLSTNIEESQVFVDDEEEPRCLTPCTIALDSDTEHMVHIVDPSGRKVSEVFLVKAGEKRDATISTEPKITQGTLIISSDLSRAKLSVDERPHPLGTPIKLEPGAHAVVLAHEAQRWQGSVDIASNETTSLMVPMVHLDTPSTSAGIGVKRVGAYALLSVGVGLVVGGALMGRQANTTFTTLDDRNTQGVTPDASMVAQGRTQQRTANVLFITGGLALAGGGGLFAWDLLSDRSGPAPTPSQDAEETPDEPKASPKVNTLD